MTFRRLLLLLVSTFNLFLGFYKRVWTFRSLLFCDAFAMFARRTVNISMTKTDDDDNDDDDDDDNLNHFVTLRSVQLLARRSLSIQCERKRSLHRFFAYPNLSVCLSVCPETVLWQNG